MSLNKIPLGDSIAQFVPGSIWFRWPKMDPEINATSFDWWYFDAISENNSCTVVVVFYMTPDLGFPIDTINEMTPNLCNIPALAIPKRQVFSERKFRVQIHL